MMCYYLNVHFQCQSVNIPEHSDPNFETNISLNQVTVHICNSGKQMSDVTSKMALG